MKSKTEKNLDALSDEQLYAMFKPVGSNETDFIERRQQLGLLLIGLPGLALLLWFLFT